MCQRKAGAENKTQIKNTITLSQYICLKEFSHFPLKVQSLAQSFSTLFHFCKNCPGSQCAFEQRFYIAFSQTWEVSASKFQNVFVDIVVPIEYIWLL